MNWSFWEENWSGRKISNANHENATTCAKEYAHEEYIPANFSRQRTVRSVAMTGRTDEQLLIPRKIIAANIVPSMVNKSCWSFLQGKRGKKNRNISVLSSQGARRICMKNPKQNSSIILRKADQSRGAYLPCEIHKYLQWGDLNLLI